VSEPYRGLDNATLLHALGSSFEIHALSPRPSLPWVRQTWLARPEDASLNPRWVRSAYLPKIGGAVNHLLMAASLHREFEQSLRAFNLDAILGSWIFPDCCAALRLAHKRVALVAVAQGTDVHQYLRMPARRRAILKHLPDAAAVITRSRDLSRLLEAAGFPAEKLHTVYNGVCLDTFLPRDQAAARREAALAPEGAILLFVGNFYEVKDPQFLIRAFAQLKDGATRLVMAGGGPLEQACRELAGRLNVAQRVLFAGRRSPREIARLMNCADLLVLPSRNEGVPNVILEAFASGLPVVASRVGGIPEVMDNDLLGSLFSPGDEGALASTIERRLAAPRDTAAIRRHAERFSWTATAARYREIILAAIGGIRK
jgi:glycosyltransferase involved in cell wall biosynthesis